MSFTVKASVAALALSASLGFHTVSAQDLKITIPRHSQLTPVQRLNREGVSAVRRHDYEKAEGLFYKAYLYDPSDPFTLNNLGYISELQGQLDRAEKFYTLAGEQGTDAYIARSSSKELEGKPMLYAINGVKDTDMQINRMNVDAIQLLSQNRAFEANRLLQHALSIEPHNVYTLNNMGVADEAVGDFEDALNYYRDAANAHSDEPVVVTLKQEWRGKPVSEMAADSEKRLKRHMKELDTDQARAAVLNMRGVWAANQNNWEEARQYFLEAYKLDPYSAFSLNNVGYVAEREGDLETAQFFYARARTAQNAGAKIGLATNEAMQGAHLETVASDNHQQVDTKIEDFLQQRRQQKAPIELMRRDGQPVTYPKPAPPPAQPGDDAPAATQPASPSSAAPAPPAATPSTNSSPQGTVVNPQ